MDHSIYGTLLCYLKLKQTTTPAVTHSIQHRLAWTNVVYCVIQSAQNTVTLFQHAKCQAYRNTQYIYISCKVFSSLIKKKKSVLDNSTFESPKELHISKCLNTFSL